jgi:hypothetical protein
MSNFKLAKKDALSYTRTNIYDLYDRKIEQYDLDKKKLPELRSNLEKLKKTGKYYEIKELQQRIDNIENDTDLNEYLLNFLPIISKESNNEYTDNLKKGQLDTFVNSKINNSKAEIYNEYINFFNPELEMIEIPSDNRINCKLCNGDSFISETKSSSYICTMCGLSTTDINDFGRPYYTENNENSEQVVVFNYRRDNHFQECLNQLQAKENTTIPPQIISDLTKEFRKYNITNPKMFTNKLVKSYLKKLGYSKYYEHIPTIINEFCGLPAPKLTPALEQQLRIMFDEIQEPFAKWKKIINPARKNFLNYAYTFYKMLQLLNKDEFLIFFPLLKSREKLYEHDMIWKGICKDLRWEFIPSI